MCTPGVRLLSTPNPGPIKDAKVAISPSADDGGSNAAPKGQEWPILAK